MDKLIVSSSPHFNGKKTTRNLMLDVIIGLSPAMVASIIFFGYRAAILLVLCPVCCVLCEWISRKVRKREKTIGDLSAVVTGVLLAMNLPASVHPLVAVFGCIVAIVVVKQMFGGIGQNFVNPALTARIVLLNSFPSRMTTWTAPNFSIAANTITSATSDAITTATPLANYAAGQTTNYMDLFLGSTAGCLGETSALALLIGGIYLVARGVIKPVIPVVYLGTAAAFSALLGRDPLFDLLSGGLILGAVFMATDYTTSPLYFWGKVVFAFGCGMLTILIRQYASLPEGVSYAIVVMNIIVPLIERYIKPRAFGKERKQREA